MNAFKEDSKQKEFEKEKIRELRRDYVNLLIEKYPNEITLALSDGSTKTLRSQSLRKYLDQVLYQLTCNEQRKISLKWIREHLTARGRSYSIKELEELVNRTLEKF